MKLSLNFSLRELTTSLTALRHGFSNTPNSTQILNIKHLADAVLQPLRNHLNTPVHVNSGYRNHHLNKLVGGSTNSHHLCLDYFAAADIRVPHLTPTQLAAVIRELDLPIEQCIIEPSWVHVSTRRPKREYLVVEFKDGRTHYISGK